MNKNIIIALDLGSSKISAMMAQRTEDGKLEILNCQTIHHKPKDTPIRNGVVNNKSIVTSNIQEIISRLRNHVLLTGRNITSAYIGLGGRTLTSKVFCVEKEYEQDTELDEQELRNLEQMAKDQMEQRGNIIYEVIPQEFNLDDVEIVNPEGCTARKVKARFLIVSSKIAFEERITPATSRVPLAQQGCVISAIAEANFVMTDHEKEMGCAMINFGAETTSIVVYKNGFIRHVAVVPFGSNSISEDLTTLRLTSNQAEEMKRKFGYAMVDCVQKSKKITIQLPGQTSIETNQIEVAKIIQARIDEIMDQVCKEIDESGFFSDLSDGIVITGGGSQLHSIEQFVAFKTGMTVRKADFSELVQPNVDPQWIRPENSVLLGLLYNAETEDDCTTPKIIPQEVPESPKAKDDPGVTQIASHTSSTETDSSNGRHPEQEKTNTDNSGRKGKGRLGNLIQKASQKAGAFAEEFFFQDTDDHFTDDQKNK